jgi:glycosyltransferase involved in cell wall biosynthesis
MGQPSLHDVLDVTSSLSRFLMPLSVVPQGDIAHTTANGLSSLSALAAYWTNGTPLLLTEHGVYLRERYLEAQKSDQNARVNAFHLQFFRRLNDATLQIANLVSPVSNYNRRWEIETGADEHRIQTIYNGVEPALFPAIDTEPDVPTVSWIGRIDPLKDVVTLVEAFARVRDEIPEAKLRLFGPVPEGNEDYHKKCLDTIAAHKLEDSVVFEGLISRVAGAHEAGHVVALSSISEGFPFTVLEAMMSGRATVSTDVGGVAEAVGDCGLLVSPRSPDDMGEAMIRLLEDEALRRELGKSARERALSLFTLDEMSGQYREAYEALVAQTREEARNESVDLARAHTDGTG